MKSLESADLTKSTKLKTVNATSAHGGQWNHTRSSVNGTAGAKWKKKNSTDSVGTESDAAKLPETRSGNKTVSHLKRAEASAGEGSGEVDGLQNMIAKDVIVTSAPTPKPTTSAAAAPMRAMSSQAGFITLGAVLVSAVVTLA